MVKPYTTEGIPNTSTFNQVVENVNKERQQELKQGMTPAQIEAKEDARAKKYDSDTFKRVAGTTALLGAGLAGTAALEAGGVGALAEKIGQSAIGKGIQKILGKGEKPSAEKPTGENAVNKANKNKLDLLNGGGAGGSGGGSGAGIHAPTTVISPQGATPEVSESALGAIGSSASPTQINAGNAGGEALASGLQNEYKQIRQNNTLNREARDRASAESRGIFD